MSKTKKLTAGVPIVGSNGAVTPVSIAELAKQVGAAIGVQKRISAEMHGGKWYRIANVSSGGYTSAIILLGHTWYSGAPSGLNLSFNASASGQRGPLSLIQLSGSGLTFDKVRYVQEQETGNEGAGFIDVHIASGRLLPIYAAIFSNGGIDLVDGITEAPQLTNEYVHELTPIKMGGGINTTLTGYYEAMRLSTLSLCEAMKGGLQHERFKDKAADQCIGRIRSRLNSWHTSPLHGFGRKAAEANADRQCNSGISASARTGFRRERCHRNRNLQDFGYLCKSSGIFGRTSRPYHCVEMGCLSHNTNLCQMEWGSIHINKKTSIGRLSRQYLGKLENFGDHIADGRKEAVAA